MLCFLAQSQIYLNFFFVKCRVCTRGSADRYLGNELVWETEYDDVGVVRRPQQVRLGHHVLRQLHPGQVLDVLVALVDQLAQLALLT